MKKVIIFHNGSSPRIYYNIDISKITEPYLINPPIPKRVPPHLWKIKNNKVVVKFNFRYFWSFLKSRLL